MQALNDVDYLIDLQSLNKEFKYYKNAFLKSIDSFQETFLDKIDTALETKYGKDFFSVLKKDFGLSGFTNIRTKIFTDFKTSIEYYLTNKYYDIGQSTFGKPSNIRFEDYDIYDFNDILNETQNILYKCVDINLKSLKRRDIGLKSLPKEFAVTELQKQIQNNLDSFNTFTQTKRNVYSPDGVAAVFNDTNTGFVEPNYPAKGTLLNTFCKGYNQYGKYADGNGGSYEQLIEVNSSTCGYTPPPPPNDGGGSGGSGGGTGGGGGGGFVEDGYDGNDGRVRNDREAGRERIEQK